MFSSKSFIVSSLMVCLLVYSFSLSLLVFFYLSPSLRVCFPLPVSYVVYLLTLVLCLHSPLLCLPVLFISLSLDSICAPLFLPLSHSISPSPSLCLPACLCIYLLSDCLSVFTFPSSSLSVCLILSQAIFHLSFCHLVYHCLCLSFSLSTSLFLSLIFFFSLCLLLSLFLLR